jgi:hypothetical protein
MNPTGDPYDYTHAALSVSIGLCCAETLFSNHMCNFHVYSLQMWNFHMSYLHGGQYPDPLLISMEVSILTLEVIMFFFFFFFMTSHAGILSLPAIRGAFFSVSRILTRSSAQALKHPGSEGELDFP